MKKSYGESVVKFYARHRNLILYGIIGCVGASLDFCIFSILTMKTGLHHQIVNIISISSGIFTNFILNYFFNFKSQGKFLLRMASFYLIGMFGLGLSALLLYFMVNCFGFSTIIAKLFTILFVTVMQYTLNKLISFKKE